jgi:hypothetical protein
MIQAFWGTKGSSAASRAHGSIGTNTETRLYPRLLSKDPELSVNLESVMVRDGRPPADAIRSYAGYGLAAITTAHARSLNQAVARDPQPEEPAHGVVYGRKNRGGVGGKLRDGAVWVVKPLQSEIG